MKPRLRQVPFWAGDSGDSGDTSLKPAPILALRVVSGVTGGRCQAVTPVTNRAIELPCRAIPATQRKFEQHPAWVPA